MTGLSGRAGVTALTCVLAAAGSACAPPDEGDAPRPEAPAAAVDADGWEVQPVPMPDLSRLPESVQDQVGERYAALAEKAAAPETPSAELARAHGDLGLILMAADFETAAVSSLCNAAALAPRDPRWPYYLGQFHLIRGEHVEAQESFERALALRPTDLPTLVRLGGTSLDHGRPDHAQRLFREALALAPNSAAALGGLGRAVLAGGNHARAVEYLVRALTIEPEATSLHYPLALAYRGLGELERADAHLRGRGPGDPTLPDPLMEEYKGLLESALAYLNRGVEAMQGGIWAEAAALFRRGLELDPENPALGHTLGTALSQMGEIDAAIEQFEDVLRWSPGYARAHFSLGVIHASRGRYREARARFAAAVEHEPDYVQARLGLADIFQMMGCPEESLPHYDHVVEVDPRRVEAWIEAANVLVGLERYEEAYGWLAAARKVHPELPEIVTLHETVEAVLALRRALK